LHIIHVETKSTTEKIDLFHDKIGGTGDELKSPLKGGVQRVFKRMLLKGYFL
jgi:hypothetical protein